MSEKPNSSALDFLLDVKQDLSEPTQREFFTRTYIKGENAVAVLKQMQLDESFVPRMISSITKQTATPKTGGAQ